MYFKKLKILEEIFGRYYQSNDEHLFFCPFCKHHKRKLSVNISKNNYKCWVCDSHGKKIYNLIKRFGSHEQRLKWQQFETRVEITDFDNLFEETQEQEEQQRVKLPEGYVCLAKKNLSIEANAALNYLKSRNISKIDTLMWKIGYCASGEYKHRIIIPSFDRNGYCNYFIARAYTNNWLKYKNPPAEKNIVFNELMINWAEPITLVEGAFDAINAENSIPLLGSTLNVHSKLFKAILSHSKRIYIALDQDAEKKALNIIKTLISHGIEVCKIDTSDYEDVGEMTKKEFGERKRAATPFDSNTLLIQKILQV